MQLPVYERALAVAEGLTVLDQETGTYVPFRLNREQRRILRTALRTKRLVIGKGRQVGCSTVVAFLMMLVAVMNPGMPCCIVADLEENATNILGKIKHWLSEIGVGLVVSNVTGIVLENGASIDARSAISRAEDGESRVGRSRSYGFIHATEMAFWLSAQAVWAGLTATPLLNALYVVESTGSPGDGLFKDIFEGAGWERLFFGIEQHEAYRTDPRSIDDATWLALQSEFGFTRRDSAAWWHQKLHVDFRGDTFRMLREYPVAPVHMFTFREGQHIRRWRLAPACIVDGFWNYYVPPETIDEPVVLGVDTAAGIGKDASALALLGHRTGRVLATYQRNDLPIPDFIELVKATITRFRPITIAVESNGVGMAVWQAVSSMRGAWEQKSSASNGELFTRRDLLREAIETGALEIGGHLVSEAKTSVINAKGKFEGADDVLSALSFAWVFARANPYKAPPPVVDRTTTFVAPTFGKKRKRF